MALIIISIFATQQKNTIHSLGKGILDPDNIHRTKTPHRNKPHISRIGQPVQTCNIKCRISIIFTDKAKNPHGRLIIVIFRWYSNSLYHGTHAVNIIVGKPYYTFRAGAHTCSTTPAACRIRFGCSFFIIIKCAKRAFFCTPFALSTSLEKKVRKCHIT